MGPHLVPSTSAAFRRALGVVVASVAWAIGAVGIAQADELDAAQRKTLSTLASYTQQIETNVKLAVDAAGPGTGALPAAKARLVRTRLAQPESLLPQVVAELTKLPSGPTEVLALRSRLNSAGLMIELLKQRLEGGAATPAAGPATGRKLDYKQEKELADARFFVDEIAGRAAALRDIVAEVAAVADRDAIDHRRMETAMNTIELVEKRAVQARSRLDPLPADGAGVKDVVDRLTAALASVAASRAALEPLHARLRAIVDPAQYPTLEADVARMQELGRMYADAPRTFAGNRARAAALVAQSAAAAAELVRFEKAYGPLMRQETDAGKRASGAGTFFKENHAAFDEAAKRQKQSLPAEIDAAIAAVSAMADTAAAERKPAFFVHAIPDRLATVAEMIELLSALDADAGRAAAQRLDKARADIAQRQRSLRDVIVDANEMPPDAYAGDDRPAIEKAAVAAWKKRQPDAEVFAVRIHAKAWHRETMWRHQSSTWYRIDRSRLQALLIVKHDDKLAVVRPVDLWIDHQSGDERTAIPLHDAKAEVEPQSLIRRDKVK